MTTDNGMNLWVEEDYRGVVAVRFKVERTLFSDRSRYQQVDVVQTCDHGRMLLNDGKIMLSERDEFVYHEMIAHVPLFVHPQARRVLIIGGGDGGTAREVLRHPQVERCVMVEIDEMVVRASRQTLPAVSASLDDPRMEVVIEDGVRFVASANERFDVVIVDSTDPIGPAEPLFDRDFYKNAAALLSAQGILIAQAESAFYDIVVQRKMLENQRPFFEKLHLYLLSNLTYPGGLWCLSFASKGPSPIGDLDLRRVERAGFKTRYYNANVHRAAFMLPTFLTDDLREVLDPLGWNQ